MKTLLVVGNCGSGKTWVMQQLLKRSYKTVKVGLIWLSITEDYIIPGIYTNETFTGTDKLSMAVSKDFELLHDYLSTKQQPVIVEGQRFMNKRFINLFSPTIIKITDDGSFGRKLRNSNQTERHLKSITTAVNNVKSDYDVANSTECYTLIKTLLSV